MLVKERAFQKAFDPLFPTLLYLFLSITTLHETIPFLLSIHIELLTILWLLTCSVMSLKKKTKLTSSNAPVYTMTVFCLLYISGPILSSLLSEDQLGILKNDEFKTLAKMMLFGPFLFWQIHYEQKRNITINCFVYFYTVLAFYFMYRYLILNEVREFDLRPLLKIRHGDPNFLSTFFSMLIPVALMQAHYYAQKKIFNIRSIVLLIISFLLFTCVLLTESRMGILATLIALSYLFLSPLNKHLNRTKIFVVFATTLLITFSFSGERIISRFGEIQDKSNSDRLLTLKNGVVIFMHTPYFGAGAHKAKDYFYANTTYPHFQSDSSPLDVHNTFLKALAELGLAGFILCSFLFWWPWKTSFNIKGSQRYFLLASMTSLTLSMMTLGILYKDLFVLHLIFIAALGTSYNLNYDGANNGR